MVGNSESPFIYDPGKELARCSDLEFDCFDDELCKLFVIKELSEYANREKKSKFSKIRKQINSLFSIPVLIWLIFNGRYAYVNFCYVSSYHLIFAWLFSFTKTKLITTIYGRDFNYAKDVTKNRLKVLFNRATFIIFTNKMLMEKFNNYYYQQYAPKLRVCRFGIPDIPYIDKCRQENKSYKALFNVPPDKLTLVCGTYGGDGMNQERMLAELMKIKDILSPQVHIIISYIYGGTPEGLTKIKNVLSNSPFTYTILLNYMNLEEMAKWRLATDILIFLPDTDQFSSAMLESLYAGAGLITGSWLPYGLLDEIGIVYTKIDKFEQLNAALLPLLEDVKQGLPYAGQNRKLIYELSSWDKCKNCWLQVYNA